MAALLKYTLKKGFFDNSIFFPGFTFDFMLLNNTTSRTLGATVISIE